MAGDMYNFELTTKHYAAFGAIGLNFVTYWFFPPYYKYTLGLTIAGGLFNLMTFPALETTQSFALSSLKVSFQSAAFLAGLVAYIINFKRANQFVIDNLTNKPTPEEQDKIEKAGFQESVGKFKEKYSSYSEEILTEIVIEKSSSQKHLKRQDSYSKNDSIMKTPFSLTSLYKRLFTQCGIRVFDQFGAHDRLMNPMID